MVHFYNMAINENIELDERYVAVRKMQQLRKVEKFTQERLKKKRDYQKEYKRRTQIEA
ncbi:hypothetical protein [Paenibacillus qinlingensis]|uniref:Uncharacterized protein n=1 Tax=Paenibacillus qinlingensis TaxID=1837343 RepID=A0ABU1P6R9_9BACL|nr:hypothetical protein [Paenibacillus qinlingensis]MDR6555463.1 hypothetical protein [Paenibacillus qinlingensis]